LVALKLRSVILVEAVIVTIDLAGMTLSCGCANATTKIILPLYSNKSDKM
jgi:hypothetical protein